MTSATRTYLLRWTIFLAALPLVALSSTASATSNDLPGESLHHLQVELLDHAGKKSLLSDYRGRPFIVTMIYAACPSACPMLIQDIKRIERALPEGMRKDIPVLLVSFDPEADTPQALTELGNRQKVELGRWKLASTSDNAVAELAAVLGVKYRRTGGGHYVHSSIISVVDADGVVRAKFEGWLKNVDEAAGVVKEVVTRARRG